MRRLLILALTLSLAACATAQKLTAANDVHALLVAIRDNDSAAFDAHVDRDALKKEIAGRLAEQGQKAAPNSLGALTALLAPKLADLAGEALIQPRVFLKVAEYYGYSDNQPIPNTLVIAGSMKPMPDGRVCATARKDGPCMLVFTQTNGVWRLSSFEGDISMLRIRL